MIYNFPLQPVGIVVGLILVALHATALVGGAGFRDKLREFPRCKTAGRILASLAALWALWLVATMDLGEFSKLRTLLVVLVPASWLLTLRYVDELLSARALGFLLLLAATPVLEAAFLKDPASRILLVILAYAWTIKGIFWVCTPYVLRDQIQWLTASTTRWNAGALAGIAYGAAILVCALAFWG